MTCVSKEYEIKTKIVQEDMIIKTRYFLAELWTFASVVKNLSLVEIDQTC